MPSLKPRIGECLMLGFKGPTVPRWLMEFEKEFGLGGVILFDYDLESRTYDNNIKSKDQLEELCAAISKLPSRPLIFIDQEGGKVRRLKEDLGFAPLPSQAEIIEKNETDRKRIWKNSFTEMVELGIHYTLAPVLDLNTNPRNPDIGMIGRSFSANVAVVEEQLKLLIPIAEEAGIGLCLKHFPGIGSARVNSHEELTDITRSLSETETELFYKWATQIPGQSVLVSHCWVKNWDEKFPVSMSPAALKRWQEFPEVLLISDDLQMQGLQKTLNTPAAVIQGLTAGLDMLIIGNNLIDEQWKMADYAREWSKEIGKSPSLQAQLEKATSKI